MSFTYTLASKCLRKFFKKKFHITANIYTFGLCKLFLNQTVLAMNDYTRLFDIIHYQNANFPQSAAISRKENGTWVPYSTQKVIDIANQASLAFLKLGLKREDKVVIVSSNRPEWNIMDLASLQAGLVNVPVYPTISATEYEFIFNDAEVKY